MFVNFFIRRPVFATVCSLLIIMAGATAIPTLPVAQFPVLAPPQVTVSANYDDPDPSDDTATLAPCTDRSAPTCVQRYSTLAEAFAGVPGKMTGLAAGGSVQDLEAFGFLRNQRQISLPHPLVKSKLLVLKPRLGFKAAAIVPPPRTGDT